MVARMACETVGVDRRARLRDARLYFVGRPRRRWRAPSSGALAGGVDVFQLRDKDASDDEMLAAAGERARALPTRPARCSSSTTAPTSRPPRRRRRARRPGRHAGRRAPASSSATDALVGLSTHSIRAGRRGGRSGADYIGVGPVHATPTKPGRPAVGVEPLALRGGARRRAVVRDRRHRPATRWTPWSRRARGASWWCAPSPRPRTPRRRRARCAPRSTGGAVARRSRKRRPRGRRGDAMRRGDVALGGAQRRGPRAARAARAGRAPARAGRRRRRRRPARRGQPRRAAGRPRRARRGAQRDRRARLLRGHVRRRGRPVARALLGRAGLRGAAGDHRRLLLALPAARLQRARPSWSACRSSWAPAGCSGSSSA